MKNKKTFKPHILDGAMGTELINRGVNLPLPLWSADANFDNKETVQSIHKDYTKAGADILTTNTFRTTSYTYRKAGYSAIRASERARGSLLSAVDLARSAGGDEIKVAGSMTSVEDCYSPDLFPGKGAAEDTYGEMTEWFQEAGVDILLFETMGHHKEIQIALDSSKGIVGEKWISLILKDENHLLDGYPLDKCITMIGKFPVSCLLLNCNQFETTNKAIDGFLTLWNGKWGVYPNLGVTDFENDYFELINETKFIEHMEEFLNKDPAVIGACCGSTPKHIEMIKTLIGKRLGD